MGATPELSACYIVADEEAVLASSLQSVRPFVDEVVVYDTGSSDRTMAIARALGARVVEGFWDDDFGAARNRALDHCRGRWVLSIDADEVMQGDPAELRDVLQGDPTPGLLTVEVVSSDGGVPVAGALRTRMVRVFSRADFRWSGRLHEQLIATSGALAVPAVSSLTLLHSGYSLHVLQERGKGERNLRLARLALDDGQRAGADVGRHQVDLARSAMAAGSASDAMDALDPLDARFSESDPAGAERATAVAAAHCGVQVSLVAHDPVRAARWIDRLERWGEDPRVVDRFRALLAVAEGEDLEAVLLMAGLTDVRDLQGNLLTSSSLQMVAAECYHRLEDHRRAGEAVLAYLRAGHDDVPVQRLLALFTRSGLPAARFASSLPPGLELVVLGQLASLPFPEVGTVLEAMRLSVARPAAVLLTAAKLWPSMSVDAALCWSLWLRESGRPQHCPLLAIAGASQRSVADRLAASAILFEVGDESAVARVEAILEGWDDGTWEALEAAVLPYSRRLRDVLAAVVD